MGEVPWHVTETAARLEGEAAILSRVLNGRTRVAANIALALEAIGRGGADPWMRMQASHELAQARKACGWRGVVSRRACAGVRRMLHGIGVLEGRVASNSTAGS